MSQDPAAAAFLKIFYESVNPHGGSPKKTFKGIYGGGNDYYQLDPDLEFKNLQSRVLGSELKDLNIAPSSVPVKPDNFKNYKSTLQGDLEGESIKPFKAPMPKGFKEVNGNLPKVKSKPEKTVKGKELGENKRRLIDDSFLMENPDPVDPSVEVDDPEGDAGAKSNAPLSFHGRKTPDQINDPEIMTRECPMTSGPLSDSQIEKTLDEAYWPFSRFGIRKIKQYSN